LKASAIKSGDTVLNERVRDFIELYNSQWSVDISCRASATLEEHRWSPPKRIPLTEDLRKLNQFLHQEAAASSERLKLNHNPETWREIADVTLAQVILFNRRRGGEAERIKVVEMINPCTATMQGEIATALSEFEKHLVNTIKRVEIRGKFGSKVPVLLPEMIWKNIQFLQNERKSGGVAENEFFFARGNDTITPIRSSNVLSEFAKKCGATHPENCTSILLHIATVAQIMNLKEN
jgi:hypothetical protein